MPKKKKKKSSNHYFTKDTENAIVQYVLTDDLDERTKLYVEHIQPAFNELVDKVVFTYKFTNLQNIEYLKDDCKFWLTTILSKFNPDNGAKAFSYFSVVTKNWFTHKAKKQTKKNQREVGYDDMIKEIDVINASKQVSFLEEQENHQFWVNLLSEVESWEKFCVKENEKKVLDAVLLLMNSIEQIDIFNKKAVYLYLREITGLNTKQIVSCLNKMRVRFRTFKSKWDDGEID